MITEDPRIEFIKSKLSRLHRVYAFISGKGGVGKSTLSALTALCLVEKGFKTGLVDLDLTNPTLHLILGVDVEKAKIIEENGVKPLEVNSLKFFTPALFTKDKPLVLKGSYIVEALRELLTIINLKDIDVLIIDMPPSVKEEILEISRIPSIINVVIASQDILGVRSALRLVGLFKDEGISKVVVIENLSSTGKPLLTENIKELGFIHLGVLPYDSMVREALGDTKSLINTVLYRATCNLAGKLIELPFT